MTVVGSFPLKKTQSIHIKENPRHRKSFFRLFRFETLNVGSFSCVIGRHDRRAICIALPTNI